jgi:hypothetical protein
MQVRHATTYSGWTAAKGDVATMKSLGLLFALVRKMSQLDYNNLTCQNYYTRATLVINIPKILRIELVLT